MRKNDVIRETKEVQSKIDFYKSGVKDFPDGKISCYSTGKNSVWRIKDGKKFRYLAKSQRELAEKLAEKKFLSRMIKCIEQKERCLKKLEQLMEEEERCEYIFLSTDSPYRELLDKRYRSKYDLLESYSTFKSNQNDSFSENLKFKTKSGHTVRSKSEVIVDEILFSFGLTYYYEPKLVLGGATVYPDFFVIDKESGQGVVIELFGMMDDARYSSRTVEKIDLYNNNGYMIGKNFFTFFETRENPLNPYYVRQVIKERFG